MTPDELVIGRAVIISLALYYLVYLALGWWGVAAVPFIALALAIA